MENFVNGGKWEEISRKQIELGSRSFQCASLDIERPNWQSDPTNCPNWSQKRKKEKEKEETEKEKGRIRDSQQLVSTPLPHASPVIFKSRVAEQRLITGAEGKAKFFGPERGTTRQGRLEASVYYPQQEGKEAQMCLFSGNNKKGRPASVTNAGWSYESWE